MIGRLSCAFAALLASGALAAPAQWDSAEVSGLGARNIGSATMSGRIAAVTGRVEADGKTTLLIGSASGGVWKSTDGGTSFRPIFDKQPVQSIGAIALDPVNKDTYWVGTGESWMRNSVSVGDGVYKTTDGGDTWTKMGLPNSEHIAAISVDPKAPDTVYVCVPGKLWSDSADRGLYKTTDGGKTWALVLKGANLSTGCSGLAMDPSDPKHLIAALWDFRRTGWNFRSGGPNADAPSGGDLMVSHDGGATWSSLKSEASGLPKGPWGRQAAAFAPSNPKIVYAFVEGVRSALFRSEDGGVTWKERDRSSNMVWRPFYFANLIIDPNNPDHLFKPDLRLIASEDGGKSFSDVTGGTHGDHHSVWIDPTNSKHVVTGDDGGLWISVDGANRWAKVDNLPVSQFYHVSLDDKDPYQVYGGLQDNSAWVGDSAYPGGITNGRWENVGGGDGFWAWADPAAPEDYVYAESQGGYLNRVNRHTLLARDIQPKSDNKEKLRFNWNTPVMVSPNEKGTLYIGAQYLFRSRDHGQSWQKISPDLTTNNPEQQKQEESGGITVDNSSAETHTTIYSISESPKKAGMIWVGTDDGNVQLTRDGGDHWANLTKALGAPQGSWVSWVEAGPHDAETAYAAVDRHAWGDMNPYLYATHDGGKTWKRLGGKGADPAGYAHVIREDPERPGLLYAGTEFGLWISADGGERWARFKGGDMPSVAVRDLAFQNRDHDLAIATHGRGIWIIDDLTPLRALADQPADKTFALLPSRPAQQRIEANGGWPGGDAVFVGDNPPDGAFIAYYQAHRPLFGKVKIEVLGPKGEVVDTLPASKRPGLNRVVWTMRAPAPRTPSAAQVAFNATQGPRWVPDNYSVRITSGDSVVTQPLKVVLDRRAEYSLADRKAQFEAAQKVSALFARMTDLVDDINGLRAAATAKGLKATADKAEALRKEIVATKEGGAITGEERIREFTDQLYGAINSWDGAPTEYQLKRIEVLDGMLKDVETRFAALKATEGKGLAWETPNEDSPGVGGGRLSGFALSLRPQFAAETRDDR
jgi:photosystem II stability/assembly factor-like uncharacterized protein